MPSVHANNLLVVILPQAFGLGSPQVQTHKLPVNAEAIPSSVYITISVQSSGPSFRLRTRQHARLCVGVQGANTVMEQSAKKRVFSTSLAAILLPKTRSLSRIAIGNSHAHNDTSVRL